MFLVVVFLIVNVITLSPVVPWQRWNLWGRPEADKRVEISFENYQISLPAGGVEINQNDLVEFVATSKDVTYGFGVFRPNGKMMFQMQVVPGYENTIRWKFDETGTYSVRSTEYSGPRHSDMLVADAIRVVP